MEWYKVSVWPWKGRWVKAYLDYRGWEYHWEMSFIEYEFWVFIHPNDWPVLTDKIKSMPWHGLGSTDRIRTGPR